MHFFFLFLLNFTYLHIKSITCLCMYMPQCRNWFFPFAMWLPEDELMLSGLVASTEPLSHLSGLSLASWVIGVPVIHGGPPGAHLILALKRSFMIGFWATWCQLDPRMWESKDWVQWDDYTNTLGSPQNHNLSIAKSSWVQNDQFILSSIFVLLGKWDILRITQLYFH